MSDLMKDLAEFNTSIRRFKEATGHHLRDGTGASDALYNLAVKHGAGEIEAAGHAHNVNGALNELQSCTYNMATLAEYHVQQNAEASLRLRALEQALDESLYGYIVHGFKKRADELLREWAKETT